MGNSCCPESNLNRQKIVLLLVGLDNAGKTVTAKGLAGEHIDFPIPTIGFSVIELKYLQYDVKIFDLGGNANIRGIWYKYFVDVHGVIFVVDSCDSDRFNEVRDVLEDMISNDKIAGKPLLILANKQDQESALDEIDIIECLRIEELVNRYKCPTLVQSCCANEMNYNHSDPGIKKGYEWIMNYIHNNYDKLNLRVQMDIIEQDIKEKQEMIEKIERIKGETRARFAAEDPDAIQTLSEYESKQNGAAVKDLELLDIYPNPEETSQDTGNNTSDSSITFPDVYYITDYASEQERPRSALQIVKHQLQMHKELRRSQSAKIGWRNKTAPVKLLPAREFIPVDKQVNIDVKAARRNVKTANDQIFTIGKTARMGPGGDFYNVETFDLMEKFEVKNLPPILKVKSRAEVNKENESNGICVLNVE